MLKMNLEGNINFKLHQSCLSCMSQLPVLLTLTIMWLLKVCLGNGKVQVKNQCKQFTVSQVTLTSERFMNNTTDNEITGR